MLLFNLIYNKEKQKQNALHAICYNNIIVYKQSMYSIIEQRKYQVRF